MNDTSLPALWMRPVADQIGNVQSVLKVEVAPPEKCAVVVVLDLSDSCGSMQVEISRLPRLLEALPRNWPLWIYRLSDAHPLHSSATVAHVCDGSVDLMRFAGNRRTIERSQATGSYLLPPLEAIIARTRQEEVSRVNVLVLTDGELFDLAPLALPQGIRLIGLTSKRDVDRQRHWNRVLPGNRLCLLSDTALDAFFQESNCAFFGSCQIELATLQPFVPILHFNAQTGDRHTVHDAPLFWNFIDGPLLLQIAASPEKLANLELVLTSLRTNFSAPLRLAGASPQGISPEELAGFDRSTKNKVHSLFEVSTEDECFPDAWNALGEAARMARERAAWIDEDGRLQVFKDAVFRNQLWNGDQVPISDSWLCLCSSEPDSEPTPGARIVVVAMERNRRPALHWMLGDKLPFGSVDASLRIEFDVMENRWMVQYGTDRPNELNPFGSQELSLKLGGTAASWKAYFSGSLR